ncbi:aprataxin and PNK-like factor isoform X1 [Argonauta hians]
MSGIVLKPIDGGESITVPKDSQTVIGRGNFLQVLDKRVSRNHGMLEVVDGTLFLTPTHANPCFYQKKGTKDRLVLPKDQQKRLEAGDMFGLLQDKFFYEVTYGTVQNGKVEQKELSTTDGKEGKKESNKETTEKDTVKKEEKPPEKDVKKEVKDEDKKKESNKVNDTKSTEDSKETSPDTAATKENTTTAVKQEEKSSPTPKEESKKESLDTPNPKKRKLSETTDKTSETAGTETPEQKEKPQKANTRSGGSRGRPAKKNKPKYAESDEDVDEMKTPKRRRRAAKAEAEEAGSSESSPPARRPSRAAAAKRNSYVDDFVIGDEYSDDDLRYRRRTYKEDDDDDENDEDFIAWDDDDSGSDWEKRRGIRSRGKNRASPKKLSLKPRGLGKTSGRKRRRRRNCDEDSEEELDSYIPRPSRRRAAARAQKEEEEEGEDEEEEGEEEGEEEEEEEEEVAEDSGKKTEKKERVPCQYGDKCSRKSASHLKEFSHPCDEDVKGTEKDASQTGGEPQEKRERKNADKQEKPECQYGVACYRKTAQHRKEFKHTIQPEPVNRPQRMRTTLKVTGGDEDFSDQPPSDEESMDEDSEWEPEAGPKIKGAATQKKGNA